MVYALIGSLLFFSREMKWDNESLSLARMRGGDKSQASWRSSHGLYGTIFLIDKLYVIFWLLIRRVVRGAGVIG